MRLRAAVGLLGAAFLAGPTAAAQPVEPPSGAAATATADALYQRAKKLMAEGRYVEACEAFAESNRIDPATGGTLLNLAVCHEKMGKVASAVAEYEQARALAVHYGRPDREKFASLHAALLRPRISTLSLTAHAAAAGEAVALDGEALPRAAWTNLPVDPGDHTLSATAAGRVAWSTKFAIDPAGEARTIAVPALALAPVAAAEPRVELLTPPPGGWPVKRAYGVALGAVGVAALGVGSAFGIAALSENATSKDDCPGGRCSEAGAVDSQHALTDANVANVCILAGLVAAGAAAYLILTSTSPPTAPSRAKATTVEWSFLAGRSPGIGGAW